MALDEAAGHRAGSPTYAHVDRRCHKRGSLVNAVFSSNKPILRIIFFYSRLPAFLISARVSSSSTIRSAISFSEENSTNELLRDDQAKPALFQRVEKNRDGCTTSRVTKPARPSEFFGMTHEQPITKEDSLHGLLSFPSRLLLAMRVPSTRLRPSPIPSNFSAAPDVRGR